MSRSPSQPRRKRPRSAYLDHENYTNDIQPTRRKSISVVEQQFKDFEEQQRRDRLQHQLATAIATIVILWLASVAFQYVLTGFLSWLKGVNSHLEAFDGYLGENFKDEKVADEANWKALMNAWDEFVKFLGLRKWEIWVLEGLNGLIERELRRIGRGKVGLRGLKDCFCEVLR